MDALAVLFGTLVNVVVIAFVARRLIGAPVGWPRTLAVSFVAALVTTPLVTWTMAKAGFDTVATAGEQPWTVLLLAGLLVAWILAVEVSVLAIIEAIVPTGTLPGPVEVVRGLPGWLRRTRRYLSILMIAAKRGLTRYVSRSRPIAGADRLDAAVALRQALTEAGVTFVKLGQMLSTRPDLVPPRFVEELSRLHSQVPPEPWPSVQQVLQDDLGPDARSLFDTFEVEPLAAASVGQVHRATLHSGEQVVVKVQRPQARAIVRDDLDIITRLAALTERRAEWARRMGTVSLAQGFARSLDEELDYRIELANLTATRGSEWVVVPRGFAAQSSHRVLTMEWLDGVPISRAADELNALSAEQRQKLAAALLDVVLRQLLVDGVFHADLHGGNILLLADGRLALLDFGAVGRMDRNARTALMLVLLGVERQDGLATTRALVDLLDVDGDVDLRGLERDVADLVMRVGSTPIDDLFNQLFSTVVRHGLRVPPMVAAAFRAIASLEGTLTLLDPDIDVIEAARQRASSLAGAEHTPEQVLAEGKAQLAMALPTLQRLPDRIASIAARLDQPGLGLASDAASQAPQLWTGIAQHLVMAVLTATAALSGTAMLLSRMGPEVVPGLHVSGYAGLVLLLFAYVLGSRLVVASFVHRRRPPR